MEGNTAGLQGAERHLASSEYALVHDYLTQRGGAERVVLALSHALPGAPVFTSLYEPSLTFPEFAALDVRPTRLNRVSILRKHHRAALPLLAPAFSRLRIDAEVTVCSSSGWAHGARVSGRKIVYCHTPARWLYQQQRYLRGRNGIARVAAGTLGRPLRRWDAAAAATADLYLANSTTVARRIEELYGRPAEVVPPPPALGPSPDTDRSLVLPEGYVLCVSRLLPYKNVDSVVAAFARLPRERLVVAGTGPDESILRSAAGSNVIFVGRVTDAKLRGLYEGCRALVAASYEDFGLTPLEAAAFGKPTVALRWGGFLDTVEEGVNGVFFDKPDPAAIADAIALLFDHRWEERAISALASRFSETRFIERIRGLVLG